MDSGTNVLDCNVETNVNKVPTENCKNTPHEHVLKGCPTKPLPNGCVKHSLDDNGLVDLKLLHDSIIETDPGNGKAALNTTNTTEDDATANTESCNSDRQSKAIGDHPCDNADTSSPMHTSQNQSECDIDSVDIDGDLTTSSDGATDSVSTAISRVSISDTESSSRTDSESKPQRPLTYVVYESEIQMPDIMRLITKDLSEPYSIYTYRYFIHNWPKLCFLAMDEDKCVGAIVCKLDLHKKMVRRGYIAMLAVDENYRRRGIGSHLVMKAIRAMVSDDCDEVVLETEITNKAALRLYENLGFVRDKRLFRYYLNGVDALRLKLWLR